jgi:methyl coenzyme M reductase alpha subunit
MAQEAFAAVDRETAVQLQRIVGEATAHGLPAEPIVAKVQFAITMKVPASRMLAAAQAVANRLEQARDALAPAPTEADILAGEDALSVGVTTKPLRRVRAARPRDPVAVPLGVLAQLVANHVSQDRATTIVIELMARGASNMQLASLGNDVNGDVDRGGSPDDALDIRVRGLVPLLGPSSSNAAAASLPGAASAPSGPKKP